MAEREGFEPPVEFPLHTLSRRAPSTTRPSLRALQIVCYTQTALREQHRTSILSNRELYVLQALSSFANSFTSSPAGSALALDTAVPAHSERYSGFPCSAAVLRIGRVSE